MPAFPQRGWLPAAMCAVALSAAAQTPPEMARQGDPLDASARVPPLAYTSAFSHYRRAGADQAIPWRDSNDTAARIGGWRAYAREAQQPEPAPASPARTPAGPAAGSVPMPLPPGHRGHTMP